MHCRPVIDAAPGSVLEPLPTGISQGGQRELAV